jgi:cytochrome c
LGFILVCGMLAVACRAFAGGDPVNGAAVFRKCAACHSIEKNVHKVGPSLYGVVDRPAASAAGYFYYTAAIKAFGAAGNRWDETTLTAFLKGKARDFLPGTNMAFAGLRKPGDIADVIAYLHSTGAAGETAPAQNPPPE